MKEEFKWINYDEWKFEKTRGRSIIWKGLSKETYPKVKDVVERYIIGCDPYDEAPNK
jgi:hypothetical protein